MAEDYLKAVWSATEWGGDAATVSSLAERFHTTKATVSVNLKRLSVQGLLVHEPYRPIELTATGRRLAVGMARRHRILETFLVEFLGYGWDEIHEMAERLEHAAPDDMIDRLDALLGHPETDPHGDPIPSREGEVRYREGASTLFVASAGHFEVVRISDAAADRLRAFADHRIRPGVVLDVHGPARAASRSVTLHASGEELTLREDAQRSLIVQAVGAADAPEEPVPSAP